MTDFIYPTREEIARIERRAHAMRAQALTDLLRGLPRAIAAGLHAIGAWIGGRRTA